MPFSFKFSLLFCLLSFFAMLPAPAQVQVLKVDPAATDPAIRVIHGPHFAVRDPQVRSRHLLILMIEGTGASAGSMYGMDSIFATMGYQVISPDYPNNVISTICAHSRDSACSDHFREEIITGTSVSDLVKVDSSNSILSRFRHLLSYLKRTDPAGGWGQYMDGDRPRWDHIIVAGHSQGAGHAAYLGKLFKVNRVLIFSGPQDYLDDLGIPAPWLSLKSATPAGRYFAFLHLKDPFNVTHQIANCDRLMGLDASDTLMIRPGVRIRGRHQILINQIATRDPHGSTLLPEFKNVWAYMLGLKK